MRVRYYTFLPCFVLLLSTYSFAQARVDCSAFTSRILKRPVRYCVMLPPDYDANSKKKFPILYFLHGLGENEQALLNSGGWGLIQDLQRDHKVGDFLMVAPEGRGSFFINSADVKIRYSDFFLTEFLPFIEKRYRVLRERRARGVTGLSMGGYGALRFAFAYPEMFGSVSAQSPALITESPRELNSGLRDAGPLARLLGSVFGNPINVTHWNQNNPFQLARKNQAQIRSQKIYFNCGEQDEYGFAEGAEALHKQLLSEKVSHEFHLYPGGHNADYFLSHLGETIEFHWHVFTGGK
ncbi:MAG TPA: alpha/beta hydrolase family protein [Terriglobales bacterium]|nr:alpha/beta hydrolase family protein [Terriglobales bacterium]